VVSHPSEAEPRTKFRAPVKSFLSQIGWEPVDLLPGFTRREAMREEGVRPYACFYTRWWTIWTSLRRCLGPIAAAGGGGQVTRDVGQPRRVLFQNGRGVGRRSGPDNTTAEDVAPDTGPYCKARERLPVGLLTRLARRAETTCTSVTLRAAAGWPTRQDSRRHGGQYARHAREPGTVSTASYSESRAWDPDHARGGRAVGVRRGRAGHGHRSVQGQRQRRNVAVPRLLDGLEDGDVILADRYYASFWLIAMLHKRNVDCVMRQHQHRRVDFRRGQRLGHEDTSLRCASRDSDRTGWRKAHTRNCPIN